MADRVYKVIAATDAVDMLVEHLEATERDHASHVVNLARFDTMLLTLTGPYRDVIQTLRNQTASRLAEVEAILDAMDLQLPNAAGITVAKTRIAAKREAARAR